MNALVTGLASALAYVACALFYQAGERRTALDRLKASPKARKAVRAVGWAALLIALWLFTLPQGWERGVTIWIGATVAAGGISLLIAAGGISLLISALMPRWHLASMGAAAACAMLLLLSIVVKGGAG